MAAERNDINQDAIIRILIQACHDAANEKQNGPRVRGIELLGKMLGLFANRLDPNFRDQSDTALIERLRSIDPQLGEVAARKLFARDSFDESRVEALIHCANLTSGSARPLSGG
jgi:hypothetical protein